MSVRIHQIAKQIGMENKELLKLLQDRGFAVKSVASTIDNISADSIIEEFQQKDTEAGANPGATDAKEVPATNKKADSSTKIVFKRPTGPIVRSKEDVERELEEKKKKAGSPVVPAKKSETTKSTAPTPPSPSTGSVPPPPPGSTARPVTTAARPPVPPPVRSSSVPTAPKAPSPPPVPPRPTGAPTPPRKAESQLETETGEPQPELAKKVIQLKPPVIVRDFAGLLGLKPFQLLSDLMERGIFASMNQTIEEDIAVKIAEAHGFQIEFRHRGTGSGESDGSSKKEIDESALMEVRPPVVCILGHVDHGKTTLLDAIRKTSVVDGEKGGITQHIGAYQVNVGEHAITFLDTPGHAAFSKMRERGASITDVAILVVAADDGFMPQTDEALKFAKRDQVSLIVAINKMDAKGANKDKILKQMQERGIPPEEWGGEVITVPLSALKGDGIEQLLEMIHLQAEVMELKAVAKGKASGTIIEAQFEQGRGPTATVIVQKGTLKVGDAIVCKECSCKVRSMLDDLGNNVKSAGPSTPVRIIGWNGLPHSGSHFESVANEREAKRIAAENMEARQKKVEVDRLALKAASTTTSLDDLFSAIESTQKQIYRVVIKADVHGSVEALEELLQSIPREQVQLDVVGRYVGPVSKKDVEMASASGAVILGFNVKLENGVQGLAKHHDVKIFQHGIIYEIIDTVKDEMADLLAPIISEKKIGSAEVRAIFPLGKTQVAGCMITDGKIQRDATAKLLRDGEVIHEGTITNLKRFKDDVNEVRAGYECGIALRSFNDYREGDRIECFEVEKTKPSL